MRFCPWCSAENASEASSCAACGRRLPPLPTRKQKAPGPATAITPAPAVTPAPALSTAASAADDERRALRTSLLPAPAAARRKAATLEPRPAGADARRHDDRQVTAPYPDPTPPPGPSAAAPYPDPTPPPGPAATAPHPAGPPPAATVQARPELAQPVAPRPSPRLDTDPVTVASPPPDTATRPIDASWLIESSGYDEDLDGPLAPPPSPFMAPAPAPALARPMSPLTLGAIPLGPSPRRRETLPPPSPSGPPSGLTPVPSPAPAAARTTHPTPTPTPPPPPPRSSPSITPPPGPLGRATTPPPVSPKATPSATRGPGRDHTNLDPPPTRIVRADELADRPFTPPAVLPIPGVPEPGLVNAARYAVTFARARWQRRRAVKLLQVEIQGDTDALDVVLGTLGREVRTLGIDNRVLSGENAAITEAEQRKDLTVAQAAEIVTRRADEHAKFEDIERERTTKVTDSEKVLDDAQREQANFEAQRRGVRDKRKELERRQKAYLTSAEQRDTEAGNAPMGEVRAELRRLAEGHRREAATLDPERQDLERRLAALDRPLAAAQTKVEATKVEVEQLRRSLHDAREGHRHRLAELDAEQGRKTREQELIVAEIHRRLVTLGTLTNLHRVERPEFDELYQRIDRLRSAINARTTEIDRLTAEREAFDRGSLLRGYAVLGGAVVLVITLIVIILALT